MRGLRRSIIGVSIGAAFVGGFLIGHSVPAETQGGGRVFEVRTYTTNEGKLGPLVQRMRDHERALFQKHGMDPIGFFVAADPPKSENTFVYILAHQNREAAKQSWAGFGADPEWKKARAESMANGPLLIENGAQGIYVNPTGFSPLK